MSAPEKIWSINNKMTSSNDMSAYGPQWVEYTRTDLSQAAVAAALEAAAMKNDNFAAHLQAEAFMFLLRDVGEAARLASEVAKLFKVEATAIRALITPAQHDALAAHVAAEVAKARAEDAATRDEWNAAITANRERNEA